MAVKFDTIPFRSLKTGSRIFGYSVFGIISLSAVVNIAGIFRCGTSTMYKVINIFFQLVMPVVVVFFLRMLILVRSNTKRKDVTVITGSMMPFIMFYTAMVICINAAVAAYTAASGLMFPEGMKVFSIFYFYPLLTITLDRFVYYDADTLYIGIRRILTDEIIKITLYRLKYENQYRLLVDCSNGGKVEFATLYKVQNERLMKFVGEKSIEYEIV